MQPAGLFEIIHKAYIASTNADILHIGQKYGRKFIPHLHKDHYMCRPVLTEDVAHASARKLLTNNQ